MKSLKVPILSIVVPTWNRCHFLGQLLDSIIQQAETHGVEDDLEVVVSDNASTDRTGALVAEYQVRSKVRIVYARNERNVGALKNFFRGIKLTSGLFMTLSGDDDRVVSGALVKTSQIKPRAVTASRNGWPS